MLTAIFTSSKYRSEVKKSRLGYKSTVIAVLVVALSLAIFLRPSKFVQPDYASIYTQSETRANWTRELLKSYPFIVGSVPVIQWDASDPRFAEKVR